MAEFTRTWEASDKNYEFYDYGDTSSTYGIFTGLTGGDMTVSMVPYNTIGENGGIVTKFLPGQTTFAPIRLSGPQSDTMPTLVAWFNQAVNGNFDNLRRHCSIAQYKMEKDSAGDFTVRVKQLVVWELIGLMPIAMPGFSYNSYQKTASAAYKFVFQAEEIIVTFP